MNSRKVLSNNSISILITFNSILIIGITSIRYITDMFKNSTINSFILIILNMILLFNLLLIGKAIKNKEFNYFFVYLNFLFIINLIFKYDLFLKDYIRYVLLILFIYLYYIYSKKILFSIKIDKLINLFLIFQIIPIFIGIYNYLTNKYVLVENSLRLMGCYSHPNPYAFHILIIFVFIIQVKKYLKNFQKIFNIFLIIIPFLFFKIGNFGGYLFLISFYYFKSIFKFKKIIYRIFLTSFYFFIVICFFAFLYKFNTLFHERINHFINTGGLISNVDYPTNSIQWRIFNWSYYIFNLKNFIIGNGLGASTIFYKNLFHDINFKVADTHNEYLRVFFEMGIIGLLLLIKIFYNILKKLSIDSKVIIYSFLLVSFFDNTFRATALIILLTMIISFIEYFEYKRFNQYINRRIYK